MKEAHHWLVETRVAQAGAVLLAAGFAMELVGNIFFESWVLNQPAIFFSCGKEDGLLDDVDGI